MPPKPRRCHGPRKVKLPDSDNKSSHCVLMKSLCQKLSFDLTFDVHIRVVIGCVRAFHSNVVNFVILFMHYYEFVYNLSNVLESFLFLPFLVISHLLRLLYKSLSFVLDL